MEEKEELVNLINDESLHWTKRQQATRKLEMIEEGLEKSSDEVIDLIPKEEKNEVSREDIYQHYSKKNCKFFLGVVLVFILIETLYYFTLIKLEGLVKLEFFDLSIVVIIIVIGFLLFYLSIRSIDDFEANIKIFRVIVIPLILIITIQDIPLKTGDYLLFTKAFNWLHIAALLLLAFFIGIVYIPFIKRRGEFLFYDNYEKIKLEIDEEILEEKERSKLDEVFVGINDKFVKSKNKAIEKLGYFLKRKRNLKRKTWFTIFLIIVVIAPVLSLNYGYFENKNLDEAGIMYVYHIDFPDHFWMNNNTQIRAFNFEYYLYASVVRCKINYINITHINDNNRTIFCVDYGNKPIFVIDTTNEYQSYFGLDCEFSHTSNSYVDFNWSDNIFIQIRYNDYKWNKSIYEIGTDILIQIV